MRENREREEWERERERENRGEREREVICTVTCNVAFMYSEYKKLL